MRLTVVFGITEKSVRSSRELMLESLHVSLSGWSKVQSEGGRACPRAMLLTKRLAAITVRLTIVVLL